MTQETRNEHDFLGPVSIPKQAYWGVHTARAKENFSITNQTIGQWKELIHALAWIKSACAKANCKLGLITESQQSAIFLAVQRLTHDDRWLNEFVVDVIQGGAGTSTNMNANEVLANMALEILGHPKGSYHILHPNDHINLSQSTNDVYPTALRLALYKSMDETIVMAQLLQHSFADKASEFASFVKMGRTQLQDAVPMTLGSEFSAFAGMIEHSIEQMQNVQLQLLEINLGATAIGTGISSPIMYREYVVEELTKISGLEVFSAKNLIQATQDTDVFASVSSVLKQFAIKLTKISNDLRLLASGPAEGFGDIQLPARQAGSSIMPGKINPVIPEMMNQVAFQIMGMDTTISHACAAGQLQLNAFEPIIGWSLFQGLKSLTNAMQALRNHCVLGIQANKAQLAQRVHESPSLATALVPVIGYEKACKVAKQAQLDGRTVAFVVSTLGYMPFDRAKELLGSTRIMKPYALGEQEYESWTLSPLESNMQSGSSEISSPLNTTAMNADFDGQNMPTMADTSPIVGAPVEYKDDVDNAFDDSIDIPALDGSRKSIPSAFFLIGNGPDQSTSSEKLKSVQDLDDLEKDGPISF